MIPLRKARAWSPGQLQVADSTLGSVVSQLTSGISLATSANNGTMNSSDVKSIGNQISGILDEVQSLANTSYQGQYIFAGGQTSTTPIHDLDYDLAGRHHL
jgi:flagellar hook-associated protein 3 FlgL